MCLSHSLSSPFISFCASKITFDLVDGGGPDPNRVRSDPNRIKQSLSGMTRRCSHCNQNGHNSRTCPNRGVKLFGVRLTEGSIRKSASMGNLSHCSGSGLGGHGGIGSTTPGSPGDGLDHGVGDGYASEDFVPGSSSSRERKKGIDFMSWAFHFSIMIFVTLSHDFRNFICQFTFIILVDCRKKKRDEIRISSSGECTYQDG